MSVNLDPSQSRNRYVRLLSIFLSFSFFRCRFDYLDPQTSNSNTALDDIDLLYRLLPRFSSRHWRDRFVDNSIENQSKTDRLCARLCAKDERENLFRRKCRRNDCASYRVNYLELRLFRCYLNVMCYVMRVRTAQIIDKYIPRNYTQPLHAYACKRALVLTYIRAAKLLARLPDH